MVNNNIGSFCNCPLSDKPERCKNIPLNLFLFLAWVSTLRFPPIWHCPEISVFGWPAPASCHPVHWVGCNPGASAYNPAACTEHQRIQSQVAVAMRTAKQQGKQNCSNTEVECFTLGGWGFLVVMYLFLSHCRFDLDAFLIWRTRRCAPLFEFS